MYCFGTVLFQNYFLNSNDNFETICNLNGFLKVYSRLILETTIPHPTYFKQFNASTTVSHMRAAILPPFRCHRWHTPPLMRRCCTKNFTHSLHLIHLPVPPLLYCFNIIRDKAIITKEIFLKFGGVLRTLKGAGRSSPWMGIGPCLTVWELYLESFFLHFHDLVLHLHMLYKNTNLTLEKNL